MNVNFEPIIRGLKSEDDTDHEHNNVEYDDDEDENDDGDGDHDDYGVKDKVANSCCL